MGIEVVPDPEKEIEQAEPPPSPNDRPACFSSTARECLFVISVTLAATQGGIYQGAIVGILSLISRDLSMSQAETTWISAAPSLAGGAFLLMFARLADMYGRKKVFLICMTCLTASVLTASFSPNAIFINVFSGIAGLFSAGIPPAALGMLGAMYDRPSPRKNRVFSCYLMGSLFGYVGGMVISGIVTQISTWRTSFRVVAVICAFITLLSAWVVLPDHNVRYPPLRDAIRSFDVGGSITIAIGISCFSAAFTLAEDAPHGWATGYVLALLIIGLSSLALFIWCESKAPNPIMPLYIWKNCVFSLVMAILCLGYITFASTLFWVSLFLQNVLHSSPIQVAGQLLPCLMAGFGVSPVCGLILSKVDNRLLMGFGILCYLGGFLLLSFMKQGASYWAFLFPSLLLLGTGVDVQHNVVNMYVVSSLPSQHQSIAGGIFTMVTKLCTTVGLGISTAIYASAKHRLNADTAAFEPYLFPFRFALALAGVTFFFVPFLKIGTQGAKSTSSSPVSDTFEQSKEDA